jgi:hypothetical protein
MGVRLDNLRAQRVAAGVTIGRLASLSNTSDVVITTLEAPGTNGLDLGGVTTHEIADRVCVALGIDRETAGFVDVGG